MGSSPGAARVLVVLPARIGSTRLPRKMLLAETGQPLFTHSAENAARAASATRVVVACDDDEVEQAGHARGLEMVRTDPEHPSGTDRVREALDNLGGEWDIVINVQADEPELDPRDLDELVRAFEEPGVTIATLSAPLEHPDEMSRPSIVKVVTTQRGDALYFSRAGIPSSTHARPAAPAPTELARRHMGVYAFRPETLRRVCTLPVAGLEACENLEQLRWLAAGERIRVRSVAKAPAGIDTRTDYEAFVARMAAAREASTNER